MSSRSRSIVARWSIAVLMSCAGLSGAIAQPQPATAPPAAPAAKQGGASSLEALAWLQGCWEGKVNLRDFREEWLPLRGDMMTGASQTVLQGKTLDFEYLRIESRPEGVFYVASPSGKKETSFRLTGRSEEGPDEIFTFESATDEFPKRLIYRHGTEGWLYVHVEGKINGEERRVIYPMRRVDCRSGELLRN
jgi:hypothetical protein